MPRLDANRVFVQHTSHHLLHGRQRTNIDRPAERDEARCDARSPLDCDSVQLRRGVCRRSGLRCGCLHQSSDLLLLELHLADAALVSARPRARCRLLLNVICRHDLAVHGILGRSWLNDDGSAGLGRFHFIDNFHLRNQSNWPDVMDAAIVRDVVVDRRSDCRKLYSCPRYALLNRCH